MRVNDVLSDREYADFNRKMNNLSAEIRRGKTASGEYIIPVNDMQGERFGVNNVLVFAKGTYQNPKITRVIRIGLDNETSIEIIRRDIYEWEATARQESAFYQSLYGTSLISEVTPASCRSYQESKIEWRRRGSGSESGGIDGFDREIQDGRGDSRSDQRDVRYSVSQSRDENYVNNRLKSYTYSDVDKIVENLTINKYGREQKTSPQDTGGQPFGKKASGRAFISPNPFCAPADRPINSRKQLVYFCKGKIALVGI